MKNERWPRTVIFLATLILLAGESRAAEQRRADPVVLKGAQLEQLLGQEPGAIGVYAFPGTWQAVPFQVDERMEVSAYNSWTTRVKVFTYAFDSGPKAKPDPDPTFDRDDELVFMASSASGQAPAGTAPAGSAACEEIKLSHPDTGASSYVYACVMAGPPAPPRRPPGAPAAGAGGRRDDGCRPCPEAVTAAGCSRLGVLHAAFFGNFAFVPGDVPLFVEGPPEVNLQYEGYPGPVIWLSEAQADELRRRVGLDGATYFSFDMRREEGGAPGGAPPRAPPPPGGF
jgi:hypothetical protein